MTPTNTISPLSGTHLRNIGFTQGPAIGAALAIAHEHYGHLTLTEQLQLLRNILDNPSSFLTDERLAPLAVLLMPAPEADGQDYALAETGIPCNIFGKELVDPAALAQMETATRLPVAVRGALMPDAHPGYGLPIGGALATRNAIIPYGVGVDIGCRMCLTVFEMPPTELLHHGRYFMDILKHNTVFGGARDYTAPEDDPVLHHPAFNEIPFLKALQPTARKQLGTSGGGNHFVEFGIVQILEPLGKPPGQYLLPGWYVGLLSHSGSRGLGASITAYYTRLAKEICRLPAEARHLAWLDLNHPLGAEYWQAMTLAGDYASACHHVIHHRISRALKATPLFRLENHHNFAWREVHDGRELIVHRKGATPAALGQLAVIPGSMTDPGYIVRGRGNPASLHSASHGAGRILSRTQANQLLKEADMRERLREKGVLLDGGGLDEAPQAYKSIETVMLAQADLVDTMGLFYPKVVRME